MSSILSLYSRPLVHYTSPENQICPYIHSAPFIGFKVMIEYSLCKHGNYKRRNYRALRGGGGGVKKPGVASTPSTPAKMDGIPAGLSTASAGQMAAQAAEKATAASEAAKATLEQAKNVAQVKLFYIFLLQLVILFIYIHIPRNCEVEIG